MQLPKSYRDKSCDVLGEALINLFEILEVWMGKIADYLESKLTEKFSPVNLEIINESHLHAGHAGDDGSGESHFRIRIVAEAFNELSRLERHRAINAVAQPKLDEGLHALAIEVKGTNQ